MKERFLFFLNFLFCFGTAFSQHKAPDCNCPKTMYADTRAETGFRLPTGNQIVLCGGKDTQTIKGETLYAEFVLAVCGNKKIIGFWGATDLCRVKIIKNALVVQTLVDLPVGENRNYQETVWTVEQIHFVKNKPVKELNINTDFPKYTLKQINSTLKEFETAYNANTDYTAKLADRLFISTISGSKKARVDLLTFKRKFTTLDGSVAESYDRIMRMLQLWDKLNPGK